MSGFTLGMMKHEFLERQAVPSGGDYNGGRRFALRPMTRGGAPRQRTSTCTSAFFGAGYGRPREVCLRPSRVKAAGEPSPFKRVRGA